MAEGPSQDPNAWKTQEFRQKIISKLDEVVRNTGVFVQKTSAELESQVFQRVQNRDEYLHRISQFVQQLQSMAENKNKSMQSAIGTGQHYSVPAAGGVVSQPGVVQTAGGVGADPINALQNLTKQPVPASMTQPGLPPGAQPQMVSTGFVPGQRLSFAGLPTATSAAAAAARPVPPGQPRTEMFVQQQQQLGAATRPGASAAGGSQPGYMMIPQQPNFYPMPPVRHNAAAVPFPNTVDMGAVGPIGGVPVPSPATGQVPGSTTLLSPGGHSPGPQTNIVPSPTQRLANIPSPGMAMNTPGNPGSVGPASRSGMNNEEQYLDKWKQLQKYVEPLKRMINKIDKDEDREVDLIKMKNLLNILSDSSKRLPMQTLLKCEQVLEKLDFTNKQPPLAGSSEHMCQPLLDAVAAHLKSPMLNHTLQRTFGPAVRALHGPPLRTESPPLKRRCVDETLDDTSSREDEALDVVFGEIARLHHRFVVSIDPSQHPGSKVISLLCRLEDKRLPNVRPIRVTLTENYPDNSPTCNILPDQSGGSPFLRKVDDILATELKHMPGRYSLTALLNVWELCVRKACAPTAMTA